ncbi:RHS repeat domain-containing protein [Prevotella disiens]|uniref:RHS repeat domain-containing protein n=1 Tax=Prevotella disiens TaxID=28130 RepID=UPI00216AC1BD|nr:RHS repeat-associated core domain-containing protein [Prevotella disiens]
MNENSLRYAYNAADERIMKIYGTMEGVYINGAPQGITLTNVDFRLHQDKMSKLFCAWFALKFHETDNFTLYPASILSVNKNRFTKHYFIGDKRIASRIGTGLFNNVYGRNGSYVTAGQQDYAERMNQIQKQKETYYKQQGIAPGVPTMKGAYGDPENTGVGYNAVLTELGNHDVPQGWIQTPKPNTTPNTNPDSPVSWNDPSNPDDPQAGYGYIPNDTTKEETFFYHSDHLGSTSYITDDKANITQYDAYLPYGELLVDEHSSSEDLPYKFNGKQFDEETGLYYYGARYMNPVTSLWYGVDPLAEKYLNIGSYVYCAENPVKLIDTDGREIFLPRNKKAQEEYLKMLYVSTGNNYAIENDKLIYKGTDIDFKGNRSQTLINVIQSGIDAKETYTLSLVGNKKDDKGVFIDSYSDKKIDVSDLKTLGKASTALQGAAIGHFLNEVQVDGDFNTAHQASLKKEGLIYGELVGDSTITERRDYPLGHPQDGLQTIIYEYNSRNKFQLQQGAISTTKGTGQYIGPVEIKETTVSSTGKLKSANKVP